MASRDRAAHVNGRIGSVSVPRRLQRGNAMKFTTFTALATLVLATPVLAEGDAAKGESDFKKCKACHAIIAADGTEIVKGGKTGPNLYGVVGRAGAGEADYKYGESILAVGAPGAR